jgi:diphthamide synthase subunit DPH2
MEISDKFETLRVAAWIRRRSFMRVALQFPPSLLSMSPTVLSAMSSALRDVSPSPRLFIIGDTSFSPCCVDEVAAQHYGADCVVHYGPTCLTRSVALPAFHVLGAGRANDDSSGAAMRAAGQALSAALAAAASMSHRLLLLWDSEAVGTVPQLLRAAADSGDNSGWVPGESSSILKDCDGEGEKNVWDAAIGHAPRHIALLVPTCKRVLEPAGDFRVSPDCRTLRILGLQLTADVVGNEKLWKYLGGQPLGPQECEDSEHLDRDGGADAPLSVVYWGSSATRARTLVALFATAAGGVTRLDPANGSTETLHNAGARFMSSRFRLVGALREAQAVGIIAGTLAAASHVSLINALRDALRSAGKSVHVLLVGKPTPAKLLNFTGAVDAFVLVACPEASLLDPEAAAAVSIPIATPFEALAALEATAFESADEDVDEINRSVGLRRALEWDGVLHLCFVDLLDRLSRSCIRAPPKSFRSLVASSAGPPSEATQGVAHSEALIDSRRVEEGALSLRGPETDAASRLAARRWRGLAYDTPEDAAEITSITQGRTGRAAGYSGEGV